MSLLGTLTCHNLRNRVRLQFLDPSKIIDRPGSCRSDQPATKFSVLGRGEAICHAVIFIVILNKTAARAINTENELVGVVARGIDCLGYAIEGNALVALIVENGASL